MVNTIVLEYLKQHSSKYQLDDLKREILAKGYTEDEYYEALKMINSKKFKSGEVSRLPNSNVASEKRKGSGFKIAMIVMLVILFVCGLVALFNYLGYSIFGFNIFDYFS